MRSAGLFLLSLAVAVMLSGCEIAETAAGTAKRLDQAHQFGEVRREADSSDPKGQRFSIKVQAKEEASWYDAMRVMGEAGVYCEKSNSFGASGFEPNFDPMNEPVDAPRMHPAGTVFEQRILCGVDYPQEVVLPSGTTQQEGIERLRAELAGNGEFDPARHFAVAASFNDRHPKYSAIAKAVGELHARGHRYCRGQGVAFPRLLVLSLPTPAPEQGVFLNRSEAFVGAEYACMDGQPADNSL